MYVHCQYWHVLQCRISERGRWGEQCMNRLVWGWMICSDAHANKKGFLWYQQRTIRNVLVAIPVSPVVVARPPTALGHPVCVEQQNDWNVCAFVLNVREWQGNNKRATEATIWMGLRTTLDYVCYCYFWNPSVLSIWPPMPMYLSCLCPATVFQPFFCCFVTFCGAVVEELRAKLHQLLT